MYSIRRGGDNDYRTAAKGERAEGERMENI
jgi:hypothetical protein